MNYEVRDRQYFIAHTLHRFIVVQLMNGLRRNDAQPELLKLVSKKIILYFLYRTPLLYSRDVNTLQQIFYEWDVADKLLRLRGC